jgi:DNA modification methylase
MVTSEYKTFEVEVSTKERIDNTLYELSTLYPKEDIYFERSDGHVIVHLKQLDLGDFKKHLLLLCHRYDKSVAHLLHNILEGIESIRSYGLKGKKRLYVGYNKERKVKNRRGKEKARGIYYYAQGNNFSSKNAEIPDEYENRIVVGDSESILKKLPDNCIDLVFTSPPYNFGLDYENHRDGTNWNEYFGKLFAIFKECIRTLKYGGRIIVNVQPLFSDYIPIHHIISDFFMREKMIWKGEIIWDKHNWNCKYTAWGSWKSPTSPYLKYTWEFLEIFCKGDLKKKGAKNNVDITANEFKQYVIAKWDIAPERNMDKFGHPAMFPEAIVERSLKLFSFKEDIILDPFNGVGTTTAVAKRLGRRYLGIDISAEYCKKAEKRLNEVKESFGLFEHARKQTA